MGFSFFVAMFLVGGIAWRVRGSGLVTDTEARYLVWGGVVGALVFGAVSNPLAAVFAGVIALGAAGLGATLGYWGQFNLTLPENYTKENYAKLTATAMFRMLPLFILSCFAHLQWHVLPAVLAGISFVPAYLAGLKIAQAVKLPLLTMFSEWGEFLFGGAIFLALALGLYL